VGVDLNITSNIAKISFEETTTATAPFLIPLLIVLFMSAYIPPVVMWLPNLLIR
jgi:TRAP-type C4-dicarboxylate transport system permease large subunit